MDRTYMRRALELAARGAGFTNPNPMVGAVIVRDGRILGEGWHERCGGPHAERRALAACTEDPRGATLYVTLEPCCHQGRTPPCTDAILQAGIARVVIGSRDPNPKVLGGGVRMLRRHGVVVTEDVLREECDALNPIFFHYITTQMPYVALKYAMTADGKIATVTGASRFITGVQARRHVHTLRHRYSGILAGIGTVLADDPLLNCRVPGGKNPVRILCDSGLRLPADSQICRTARQLPTIVACAAADAPRKETLAACGIEVLEVPGADGRVDLQSLMRQLGARGIDSVLAEGGSEIHYSLLSAGLVQKVYAYVAPKLFGGQGAKTPVGGVGVAAPDACFLLSAPKITTLGDDLLLEYERREADVYRHH